MLRTRAERRKLTWHKALRRRELEIDTNLNGHEPQFDNLHEYSKSKLYSVGRRRKTNNKGEHRYAPKNYSPSKNWKHSDQQTHTHMDDLEQNFYEDLLT